MTRRLNTASVRAIARVMLADPHGRYYCAGISNATGIDPSTISPILVHRFLPDGWIVEAGTGPSPIRRSAGRRSFGGSPRKYYTLTDLGRAELAALLARHSHR